MPMIPSNELKASSVPSQDSPLHELIDFAHTFDGYKIWGSFEKCAEIANGKDHSTLDALRTCLFFEARRWRHSGSDPDAEARTYWQHLLTEIRSRVERS